MANVRQMPELCLRGSLANITMANLTAEQRQHVDQLVTYIADHPEMQKHKARVLREFAATIGADYSDDRDIALEEYHIAIWRGVVDLFYHRKYSFRCRACTQGTYTTKRGKLKPIDRVQAPCPNCRMVEVVDGGCLGLTVGDFINFDTYQETYSQMPDGWRAPKFKSTIDYIPGERKYKNPERIVEDDKQLRKFFSEFVWNYFRQQLAENKRQEHRKEPQGIIGDTAWVITQELISLCNRMDVDYNFCDKTEPKNGRFTIQMAGLQTPPEFTAEFAVIREKALRHKTPVNITPTAVEVVIAPDALPLPMIQEWKDGKLVREYQALVTKPEHVAVLDGHSCVSDEQDSDFTIQNISYRTVGGERMDLDDHEMTVDSGEVIYAIRDALPDGHCKDVFDLWVQQGEIYSRFSDCYGDGKAKINHIAEFLGITPRAVKQHQNTIKVMCLAYDLVPVG